MYEFDYVRAASLDDAAKRLGSEEAKLVAGGDLVP
jgi:CO/xanthine dehydrogenase FAD-binding subunit